MSELVHLIRPAADPDPQGAIVLLHGRGADEHDLHGFLDVLDPERRWVGVTPGGPLALPPGGRHWYVVPRVGHPDPETFQASFGLLHDLLSTLPERTGVPWERTVIGGFSQGAVMAYALGLGPAVPDAAYPARPRPAGILAMSGFMATVPGFEHDLGNRQDFPVCITHGSLDPVIDIAFARQARVRLEEAGADVTYRESPMPHTIDPRAVPDIAGWVRDRLS